MKNVIKLFTPVVLMLLFAMSSNAQTASTNVTEGKKCDPKACEKLCDVENCDPKLCQLLIPQCCAKDAKTSIPETPSLTSKNVRRVASATAERTTSSAPAKPACTAGKSKKCCAKKGN